MYPIITSGNVASKVFYIANRQVLNVALITAILVPYELIAQLEIYIYIYACILFYIRAEVNPLSVFGCVCV